MLSRLKRRTASSSLPPDEAPNLSHDDPPSPTASRRSSTTTNITPSKQSIHSNRTLSPSRHPERTSSSMSRSSSYGSIELGHGHPRSAAPTSSEFGLRDSPATTRVGQGSLSLDHLSPANGQTPLTLVVQAPELMLQSSNSDLDMGPSRLVNLNDQDEDVLATPMPGRPAELRSTDGHYSITTNDPSSTASLNPSSASTLHVGSMPMNRPRAYTTSEAMLQSSRSNPRSTNSSVSTIIPTRSGLDALAQINNTPLSEHPPHPTRSHSNSLPTSPPSGSRPASRSVSRPNSRSPSFNSESRPRPSSSSLTVPPPTSTSPTRSRSNTKTSPRGGSNGIAGAIALSGVALASPSSQLRHPLGLARVSSSNPSTSLAAGSKEVVAANGNGGESTATGGGGNLIPVSPVLGATMAPNSGDGSSKVFGNGGGGGGGSGKRSAASSIANGVTPVRSRESIDSGGPVSPPDSRRESEVWLNGIVAANNQANGAGGGGNGMIGTMNDQGFLSMDQLGDFDDVVSQLGTGYAVASSKRNAEFHALFKNIPDDDYLIEDYGCALQREILIQGRLYISEHHLSFNANIFGWVTSLTIPFAEVCSIEKRMTAYVIPNAIQIATMHARHTFASFLSRDTTYDLIGNIWRMVHPVIPTSAGLPDHHDPSDSENEAGGGNAGGGTDAETGIASGVEKDGQETRESRGVRKRLRGFRRPRGGTGESSAGGTSKAIAEGSEAASTSAGGGGSGNNSARPGTPNGAGKRQVHPTTKDTCPTLKNLKETCMDTIFPSAPEKIYNLMFTSGFMKDFWTENQKLLDLQIGDWAPQATGSNLLARSFSYIKPLNGSIGPRQTKCLITDESAHVDFDDFVCVVTTTRTPDVPSGSAFAVKTRTSMTWAKGNSCRVIVTTGVEWSKSSFIKGIIEKSCIEGQKQYHIDLEKAMRAYITTHRNEFIEEGQSDGADEEDVDSPTSATAGDNDEEDSASVAGSNSKVEDRSRNWATPILESLEPIFDIVSQQSPKTLALGLVVFILVISNLWTLRSSSGGNDANLHPSKRGLARASSSLRNADTESKSPDEVASAVRDVLQDYFKQVKMNEPSTVPVATSLSRELTPESRRAEVADIGKVLDELEERIKMLRRSLAVGELD